MLPLDMFFGGKHSKYWNHVFSILIKTQHFRISYPQTHMKSDCRQWFQDGPFQTRKNIKANVKQKITKIDKPEKYILPRKYYIKSKNIDHKWKHISSNQNFIKPNQNFLKSMPIVTLIYKGFRASLICFWKNPPTPRSSACQVSCFYASIATSAAELLPAATDSLQLSLLPNYLMVLWNW